MATPIRTYGVATPAQLTGKTGLEQLRGMIDGTLPAPTICETLHFRIFEAGDGFAAFEGETGPHILNPAGLVHGGWALSMVDSACGCAALSLLEPGYGFTTIETKVNFIRPILLDTGRVRAEATLVGRGRQIMSAECKVTATDGRVLAHGTSTIMALKRAAG